MLREEQIRLLKGLISYQESGTNVDAGGIIKNPSSSYTCENRFKEEWNTFFKDYPQVVGMTGDLPEPGTFITREDFGIPTLITRDENGKLAYSLGGYQHNSLFRNNGDGTFTEVGYLENADRLEDGYIVAAVDIDNDGRQDLVMRNTDPALEHSYAPVVLLRNTQENANTACVKLDGKQNPVGAKVFAEVKTVRIINMQLVG